MSLELPQQGSSRDNPQHMCYRKKIREKSNPRKFVLYGAYLIVSFIPFICKLGCFL